MILGMLFVLLVVGSSIMPFPPLSLFMDAGEYISDSWAVKGTPPVDNAERKTLLELCDQPEINIPLSWAVERLKNAGIRLVDPSFTLEDLAEDNGTSPAEIWAIISDGMNPGP